MNDEVRPFVAFLEARSGCRTTHPNQHPLFEKLRKFRKRIWPNFRQISATHVPAWVRPPKSHHAGLGNTGGGIVFPDNPRSARILGGWWVGRVCRPDSGAVKSNRSTNIPFAGDTLHPDTEYAWQVQWTDTDGATSPMSSSEEGRFSTGLLTRSDWADAQWISVRNPGAHTILRKRFTLSSHVRRITAYVVGLGYYKLWVDGTQVSQHELGAFTTYSERVLYDTHDCTAAVHRSRRGSGPSEHAVIVELGPGWYAQQSVHAGEPSALLRVAIHYVNNTVQNVVSDASWEGTAGPVAIHGPIQCCRYGLDQVRRQDL